MQSTEYDNALKAYRLARGRHDRAAMRAAIARARVAAALLQLGYN